MNKRSLLCLLPLLAGCDLALEADRRPDALRVTPDTVYAIVGESAALQVSVLDQDGVPFDRLPAWGAPVWSSSTPIVEVRGGTLHATASGQTQLRATLGEMSATALVRINPAQMALQVGAAYLVQSTQRPDNSVPIVAGRQALLRVFLTGDQANFFQPRVRVTLYDGESALTTLDLSAEATGVPIGVGEGSLRSSWNAVIPASLVRPGLGYVVEADPQGVVPRAASGPVRHPASGRRMVNVVEVPTFRLRVVPVHLALSNRGTAVTESTLGSYVRETLRMHPIADAQVELRPTFTSWADVRTGNGWGQLLNEIAALQTAEGAWDHYYYGIMSPPPGSGIAGLGYLGYPASIGYDQLPGAAGTLAHELGHNFNRRHTPCGDPAGVDNAYPYPDATLGSWGYDAYSATLRDPQEYRDLMSYCGPEWISDYTFNAVLGYRRMIEPTFASSAAAGASLLVWGRIENGRPVLEPAFSLSMPVRMPSGRGAYRVEGFADDGARLFSYAFDGVAVDHAPGDDRHFAFAIPAALAGGDRLARLRVTGPRGAAERVSRGRGAARASIERGGGRVRARWQADAHPMALVREAGTGRILAFARGGDVRVPGTGEVEVILSDGVRSARAAAPR